MTILCIGGYFKDNKSIIISNMIVLWAPLEMLSIFVQLGLSLFYAGVIVQGATGFVFFIYILLNILFCIRFDKVVNQVDDEYKFWRGLHPLTAKFVLACSGMLYFKISRLKYSYLYGFDNFKARFSSPDEFISLLKRFVFSHIILCNGVIIAVDVYSLLNNFSIGS